MCIDVRKLKRAAGKSACFVEVGHGDMPAFGLLGKMPLADQLYLGLDIRADRWEREFSSYDLARGRRAIDGMRREGHACYRGYIGTEGALPLGDGSVDTVFMHMITNDSLVGTWTARRLISETARVLRSGGIFAAFNAPPRWKWAEIGDLRVDFPALAFGMAINGCGFGRTPEPPAAFPELNGSFFPLAYETHLGFLDEYGVNPEGYEPGRQFSIFRKG